MNDREFAKLLRWFELSWEGYRKVRKGVKKRISHHMQELGCRSVDEYLERLGRDVELAGETERLLAVSISRFFRDRYLWEVLESRVVPELIATRHGTIKVWSAGCARGEEIYSLKIVWCRLGMRLEALPAIEAWATDVNPVVLNMAKDGIYSRSSLKELPAELLEACFEQIDKTRFAVRASLKEGIVWRVHNLLRDDPPQVDFHLIFLRNSLLTYYEDPLRKNALSRVLNALVPGGLLIIGAKEHMPQTDALEPTLYRSDIWRRV